MNEEFINPLKISHEIRACKFNLTLTWIVSIILTAQGFSTGNIPYALKIMFATSTASIISTIVFFLGVPLFIKGFIIPLMPLVFASILSHMQNGMPRFFLVYALTLIMCALYFNTKYLITYTVFFTFYLITVHSIPSFILLPESEAYSFTIRMIVCLCSALVLFFLTKWGNNLVDISFMKEKETKELLTKLQETMTFLKQQNKDLDSNINESNLSVEKINNELLNSSESMKEISLGSEAIANSLSNINSEVTTFSSNIEGVYEISNNVSKISKEIAQKVSKSDLEIKNMLEKMNTIKVGVTSISGVINTLQQQMKHIGEFLGKITKIAYQTNLLSLNAAIEAARAGESGKGFAVVANEVSQLASEIQNTVEDIKGIITDVQANTKNAVNASDSSKKSVDTGFEVLNSVSNYSSDIRDSFSNINKEIEKENEIINGIKLIFNEIQTQSISIASSTEEHSSTSNTISKSLIDNQNFLQSLVYQLNDLKELSFKLQNLFED